MKLWILAALAGITSQAVPPRDTAASLTPTTGVVRGRVTAAATRTPLHRVRVTMSGASPAALIAVTDTSGAFEITGVLPGSYTLSADRSGYLVAQYGQRRPREMGRRISIRAGETVEHADLALVRGGVLAGAVSDDAGEPYAGVRVDALEFRYIRGRRVLVSAAFGTTNDLGRFRLGRLHPGTYLVRTSSEDAWEEDEGKGRYTYAMTYFPGVTGSDQAQSVSLETGQELPALDFSLRRGRAAQITGRVETSTGDSMPLQVVSLSVIARGVGGALFSSGSGGSTRSDANGAFAFELVPPGEYLVSSGGQSDRVSVPLTVGDGDSRYVVLTPRRPATLTGTIVTDEGKPPPLPPGQLRVDPVAADPETLFPPWGAPSPTSVVRDWTFRFENFNGQYLLRVSGLRDEWMLASVSLDGRDITDTPIALKPGDANISGVRIAISPKGGTVRGQVMNLNGSAAPDATVLLFSTAQARWTIASRFVRTTRPDTEGRFTIGGLPAGAYYAVARDYIEEGRWEVPEFLASLTRHATRVELAEGDAQSIALKLEPPQ